MTSNQNNNDQNYVPSIDEDVSDHYGVSNADTLDSEDRLFIENANKKANQAKLAAAMTYIWTLKKIQRVNRLEKKSQSARLLDIRGSFRGGIQAPPPIEAKRSRSLDDSASLLRSLNNEHTPLMTNQDPLESSSVIKDKIEKSEDVNGDDVGDVEVSEARAIMEIIFGKGIVSWFLLFIPLSLWAVYHEWSATWIFWLNFFVLIPLASILGDFTEEVALHTNEVTGGLINASFGNAVEVVVAIQALLANEIRVVQASMIGSIFSNLLLVLGCCFFFGGLYHKEQQFNHTAATANMALLALSSIALVLPTPFAEYYDLHDQHVLTVSRIAALFLIFMYGQLLVFQLRTHAHLFGDGEDDHELASVSFPTSCIGLIVITLLVAWFSDYLVNSIEGFTEASGVSRTFVGLILLPIVGNAVEHVSAVSVSIKNKMDLAMGIALGSSTQISLFVVPLTVITGWITDKDMTLNFPHFEIILFILSVFTVSVICSNPLCNWLEGSLLVTTYCLVAVGFWFEDVRPF